MASQASRSVATIPESAEAQHFGLMQRQARMFAMSPLVPEHLRKGTAEQAMANCYIAMTIADRMGEDRMTVMQNIHIVHGTAGFKAQYMIARANASGVFRDGIDWEISGKGADLSVTAYAKLASTGRRVEITVDMGMAKAEKWTSNAKYQTMPEIMLRYRSGTFLVRMYAPQVMLGYQTVEEREDLSAAAMPEAEPLSAAMLVDQSQPANEDADPETGEVIEANPEPIDANSEQSPTEAKLVEIRGGIIAARNAKYLDTIDGDWIKARAAYDDETAAEIDNLIAAKRRAFAEGEGVAS
jgi:hypothetical protein